MTEDHPEERMPQVTTGLVLAAARSSNVSGTTSPRDGPSGHDDDDDDDEGSSSSSTTATHDSSPLTEERTEREAAGPTASELGDRDNGGVGGHHDDPSSAVAILVNAAGGAIQPPPPPPPPPKPASAKAAKKPSILGRRPPPPPKMRIKLSLRTLPTLANRKAIPKPKVAGSQASPEVNDHPEDDDDDDDDEEEDGDGDTSSSDGDGSVKAVVVDSDEGEDDEVVASVVVEGAASPVGDENPERGAAASRPAPARRPSLGTNGKGGGNKSSPKQQTSQPPPKRRSQPGTRPIRMPPIASPALLMPQPATSSMASASSERDSLVSSFLTLSSTSSANHKKSGTEGKAYVTPASVFDHSMEAAGYTVESRTSRPHRGSSVKRQVGDMFDSNTALTLRFPSLIPPELMEKVIDGITLPKLLIDSIPRKRRRRFADMVPTSLTINYPEDYVQKRIEYVRQVAAREAAIVMLQESQEDVEDENVAAVNGENDGTRSNGNGKIIIPPIPEPPPPPTIKELVDFPADLCKDQHPLYPPRYDHFASHLDPQGFHITEGRYFGLATNCVADPNFVGPNAPGLTGVSTGSGLATSSAGGGGISGAMALTLATTFNGVTAGAVSALKSSAATPSSDSITTLHEKIKNDPDESPPAFANGPKPTATSADLKKVMDQDDDLSSRMKQCIIRAAVHASRSGRHWQTFVGPNRETYPDISKAFAAHGGIKPCERCKSNKQGAYHCRLRRRHRQLDFDGGDSLAVIDPLFSAPMDSLLERL